MNVHGHVDMGSFQIYKGVPLAIKAGDYGTYGSSQHNYNRNAIGSNTVLFTDPGNANDWGNQQGGGGQKRDCSTFAQWLGIVKRYGMQTARIVAFDPTPGESRVKADLSKTNRAAKCTRWTRELVWLADTHLIVADVIEKGDPKIETRWLLHSLTEPKVDGDLVTIRTALEEGVKTAYLDTKPAMLFCRTLLPAKPAITKIGGPGKECFVAGRNAIRGRVTDQRNFEAQIGRWRVEVTPADQAKQVVFLHVLTPTEDGGAAPEVAVTQKDGVATITVDGRKTTVTLGVK
jgi:heparin/heparan-sulfate lyase